MSSFEHVMGNMFCKFCSVLVVVGKSDCRENLYLYILRGYE